MKYYILFNIKIKIKKIYMITGNNYMSFNKKMILKLHLKISLKYEKNILFIYYLNYDWGSYLILIYLLKVDWYCNWINNFQRVIISYIK